MKKDTLIFIVVSLILGAGLIIGLNKLRPASGALVEDNTVDELQNINTNEKENLDQLSSNPTIEKDYSMPATFSANQTLTKPAMMLDLNKTYLVTLNTNQGPITIELDTQNTPITSNNFVYLAEKGFYNNTVFHRVLDGFMIQGGDPRGDGTGGPGYHFDDEDFVGEYTRGTVAMANSGPNTNGSQFFIMHQDYQLPKNYVIFGHVVEGLEVVDAIATAPVEMSLSGEKSRPINPVVIKSAIVTSN
ncbi:MAG TPA: peptidylprolyl isomerase [Candidatus Woesebacteria bacterium]|jgi:cyclophilin family peptidyl-prolyl cis-trans isomerase|nr:peptidylprolyl isomerase [Candidatus Woesebacteria bacterium]HOI05203.1 peptidylprolyl isomerase [Candidatus Woesebacteria bacterium]HOP38723.1 peptidylprolyl isomerase [Candidatus Woesebacteria bacterium]HPA61707.1 peptidylprolyl isomerase [Candidatus Woesebacteria bacterium]HPK08051.1 peptidylprolyl isomerase [Candidatus Woesebacteria bacterium]